MTEPDSPLDVAVPLGAGKFVVPGNRWDLLDGFTPATPVSISVVVPYFNAQRQLDRMFVALSRQTHPAALTEVIVADDGSTRRPLLRAPGNVNIRLVTQPDAGFRAAAARNLGASAATGDVLCFLDVDTVPEPGYLQALSRLPALIPDALVTGRRRHADLSALSDADFQRWLDGAPVSVSELPEPHWLRQRHQESGDLLVAAPDAYRFVLSAVLACSKSLFVELGGFDESFVRYGGEDWELAHRALCGGAVLAHVPDAVAWHDGPSWAERGDADSRRRDKNAETLTLTRLIPDVAVGGRPWTGRPNVVVEIETHGEECAAVVLAVHSILAGDVDAGVWLRGDCGARVKAAEFALDPRVSAGPVPTGASASARVRVGCSRPMRVDTAVWPALLGRLTAMPSGSSAPSSGSSAPSSGSKVGQLVIHTGDGVMTMTSASALARVARWSSHLPQRDLLGQLFGRAHLIGADHAITAVERRPHLAHGLAHLRD